MLSASILSMQLEQKCVTCHLEIMEMLHFFKSQSF